MKKSSFGSKSTRKSSWSSDKSTAAKKLPSLMQNLLPVPLLKVPGENIYVPAFYANAESKEDCSSSGSKLPSDVHGTAAFEETMTTERMPVANRPRDAFTTTDEDGLSKGVRKCHVSGAATSSPKTRCAAAIYEDVPVAAVSAQSHEAFEEFTCNPLLPMTSLLQDTIFKIQCLVTCNSNGLKLSTFNDTFYINFSSFISHNALGFSNLGHFLSWLPFIAIENDGNDATIYPKALFSLPPDLDNLQLLQQHQEQQPEVVLARLPFQGGDGGNVFQAKPSRGEEIRGAESPFPDSISQSGDATSDSISRITFAGNSKRKMSDNIKSIFRQILDEKLEGFFMTDLPEEYRRISDQHLDELATRFHSVLQHVFSIADVFKMKRTSDMSEDINAISMSMIPRDSGAVTSPNIGLESGSGQICDSVSDEMFGEGLQRPTSTYRLMCHPVMGYIVHIVSVDGEFYIASFQVSKLLWGGQDVVRQQILLAKMRMSYRYINETDDADVFAILQIVRNDLEFRYSLGDATVQSSRKICLLPLNNVPDIIAVFGTKLDESELKEKAFRELIHKVNI